MQKRRNRHLLYSLLMAGTMTGCVSATVTVVNLGFGAHYTKEWLHSWAIAFPVGFFLLLVFSPFFNRLTDLMIGKWPSRKHLTTP